MNCYLAKLVKLLLYFGKSFCIRQSVVFTSNPLVTCFVDVTVIILIETLIKKHDIESNRDFLQVRKNFFFACALCNTATIRATVQLYI